MKEVTSGRGRRWVSVACACGAALVLSAACGADDGAKKAPHVSDSAGAGGDANEHDPVNGAGERATPVAGAGGGGSASTGEAGSGSQVTPGGSEGVGGSPGMGGDGGVTAGAAGMAGAAGAGGASCEAVDPTALAGLWTSNCNGYTCKMYVAASGKVSTGCSNGQYESGTLDAEGTLATAGEGGAYAAFSTLGVLTALDCSSLKYDYKARIPPNTGPELAYSCTLTRVSLCQPTLLESLAGAWETTCGNATCTTTFTVNGGMTSTCSNGQQSTGAIDETGAFADSGSGGNFPAYSTTGVVALTGCDSFLMPYTYQTPPNQGSKHSAQCSYVRKVE